MRSGIALVSGVMAGFLGSFLWRWAMVGLVKIFHNRQFEGRLANHRSRQQKQLSPARRYVWSPMLEEVCARGSVVGLWFALGSVITRGTPFWAWCVIGIMVVWVACNANWVVSHEFRSSKVASNEFRSSDVLSHEFRSSGESEFKWLHRIQLSGYALAYTAAWIVAGLGVPPRWPDSVISPLSRGFLAASIAHMAHNVLIDNAGTAGRLYRRLRGVQGD